MQVTANTLQPPIHSHGRHRLDPNRCSLRMTITYGNL
jgi:hypothetical protein